MPILRLATRFPRQHHLERVTLQMHLVHQALIFALEHLLIIGKYHSRCLFQLAVT